MKTRAIEFLKAKLQELQKAKPYLRTDYYWKRKKELEDKIKDT